MRLYTGKANSVDEAIRDAAQAAIANKDPDAMIDFVVEDITGLFGGIAGFQKIHVTIKERELTKLQLCNDALEFTAFQCSGIVTIVVYGVHPTAGYKVELQLKPIKIFPPQYSLTHVIPTGPVAQVITPFTVTVDFLSKDRVEQVIVEDADGQHKIKVQNRD